MLTEVACGSHSPFVEYRGVVPAGQIEDVRLAVEEEANRRVTAGGAVSDLGLKESRMVAYVEWHGEQEEAA